MAFDGSLIRSGVDRIGYTLSRLADELGVSRQSVNSWIGGQVPRGQHLVKLCGLLGITPTEFFSSSSPTALITVPLHRTIRGNKAVTPEMKQASQALAEQYLNLFRQAPTAAMVPVVRMREQNERNASAIAGLLRDMSGVDKGSPMGFTGVFNLLAKLQIYAVFCPFPAALVRHSYAFYCRIAEQRVVFVNIDTNVLDLIFFLLHETVHAIRDEKQSDVYTQDEETFCDAAAGLIQFPDRYLEMVAMGISGMERRKDILINRLKEISQENKHSLWGVFYRLERAGKISKTIDVGGAAANLLKKFPTVRQLLYGKDASPRCYIDRLYAFSPNFMRLVEQQVPDCSVRKLGEWLGLDTSVDAQAVMDEIARRKGNA